MSLATLRNIRPWGGVSECPTTTVPTRRGVVIAYFPLAAAAVQFDSQTTQRHRERRWGEGRRGPGRHSGHDRGLQWSLRQRGLGRCLQVGLLRRRLPRKGNSSLIDFRRAGGINNCESRNDLLGSDVFFEYSSKKRNFNAGSLSDSSRITARWQQPRSSECHCILLAFFLFFLLHSRSADNLSQDQFDHLRTRTRELLNEIGPNSFHFIFRIFPSGHWRPEHHLHIAEELRYRDCCRRSHPHAGGGGCHPGTARQEATQERIHDGIVHLQWTVHEHRLQPQ